VAMTRSLGPHYETARAVAFILPDARFSELGGIERGRNRAAEQFARKFPAQAEQDRQDAGFLPGSGHNVI
jgi:hypothetical protein